MKKPISPIAIVHLKYDRGSKLKGDLNNHKGTIRLKINSKKII